MISIPTAYSAILVQKQHRQYMNKGVWPYFNKTLFIKPGGLPGATVCQILNIE
jgi:hypothetical protein